VCPIQFHFLLFIWISIGFCFVILYSSSFVILLVHLIFIIFLSIYLINVCNLLVIWLVVFQVSQAEVQHTRFKSSGYVSTDLFTCYLLALAVNHLTTGFHICKDT
jgi:hypothetical protein